MFRPSWKYVLVGAIAVLALTTVSQSYACCGWGYGYGYGYGYGCGYGCNSCGWNCGYTPACYTVSYAPCCGDCAPRLPAWPRSPAGSWTVQVVRRLLRLQLRLWMRWMLFLML